MVIRRGGSYYLFGKVAVATVFVLILMVGTLEIGATQLETTSLKGRPVGNFEPDKVLPGDHELVHNPELGRNFETSKRKVPRGPDPIHNRKAGKSWQPPGLA